ncbi:MAG: glycoside hydrolase family 3 protein [Lachnospiraceae bacterium]|nr:glycoside hydrolase family 3 protein [Lachnospiraceae bacterium]
MRKLKMIILLLCTVILTGILCGCKGGFEKENTKGEETTKLSDMNPEDVDDITMEGMISDALSKMTLKEKIGQMFIVSTDSLDFDSEKKVTDKMKETLQEYKPGGVIFFSYNLKNQDQIKTMIQEMQDVARIPMFMSVDEEGGSVARIANTKGMGTTKQPSMKEIGATKDATKAEKVGETIGKEIHALGFNLNFAPVADISTNEGNTEIGSRSFGSDADIVSQMVAKEVKGLQTQGVSATLKHFPGQGDAAEDTHCGFVDLDTTIDRLRDVEFLPFEKGISAGADFVMVSHVSVSQVTGTNTPSSLSKLIVNDILREELQYDNIIITDAMNMKVITKFYDPDQAAVMAICAGNDMVLMPDNFEMAYHGVLDAVKDGTISERKIDEAVGRILRVKIKRGIIPLTSGLFHQNSEK